MNKQTGFTLIELIMVIVILGILAATAIPRFIDLSTQAEGAAHQGVLGAVQSTLAINYAASVTPGSGVTLIAACTNAAIGAEMAGGMPAGYTIGGTAPNCTLTQDSTTNVLNFTLLP